MRVLLFQRYASYRFIADFTEDFRAAGHVAEWLPPTEGPHLPSHVRRFAPDCVFCVGASPAVAKAVAGRVPCIFYELDKILNFALWDGAPAGEQDVVFTTYRDDIATFHGFGFRHVHYLPFCPNIARTAAPPSADASPEFGLSFVGSIVREQTNDYRTLLTHGRAALAHVPERLACFESLARFLADVLHQQDRHLGTNEYLIPAALHTAPARATEAMNAFQLTPQMLAGILAKEAAHRQRRHWLSEAGSVDLWSPEAPDTLSPGLVYRGPATQYADSGPIFTRSLASFNLQRLYARDGLSDRVFNVLASGGCLLADANPALLELFEPGHELETFSNPAELRELAARLRAEPGRRQRIAAQGHRCLQSRHLFRHRIAQMLARLPGAGRTQRFSLAPRPEISADQFQPLGDLGSLPHATSGEHSDQPKLS